MGKNIDKYFGSEFIELCYHHLSWAAILAPCPLKQTKKKETKDTGEHSNLPSRLGAGRSHVGLAEAPKV